MPAHESSLLARVAGGDDGAVRDCLDRFGNLVWALARRMSSDADDAADAVQEIFITLWRNAGRFDAARGSEDTFVAMIARRRLIDRLRKRKRRPAPAPLEAATNVAEEDQGDPVATSEEAGRALAALRTLRPDQQRVVRLAVHDGWTHRKIAEHLAMPLGTVKTHVRRGLQKVRALLAGETS